MWIKPSIGVIPVQGIIWGSQACWRFVRNGESQVCVPTRERGNEKLIHRILVPTLPRGNGQGLDLAPLGGTRSHALRGNVYG